MSVKGVSFFFFPICFGNRACSLFSLICAMLQLLPFLEVTNATSPNLKSGLSLWELIKGNYLFLVDLLRRTYDNFCMVWGFVWFFVLLCFFFKPTGSLCIWSSLPRFANDLNLRLPFAEVKQLNVVFFSHRLLHRLYCLLVRNL